MQDPKTNRYLVKWLGYPASENSWEPEENLKGCPLPLKTFLDDNGWGVWEQRTEAEARATLQTLAVYKRSGWASAAAIEAHKGIVLFLLELGVPAERLNTGIFPGDYTKAKVLHFLHYENGFTGRSSPPKGASKDGMETATYNDHRVVKFVHDGQFGCDPGSGLREKSYFVDMAFWQLRCQAQNGSQNTARADFMSHHAGDPAQAVADWGVYCTKVGELLHHLADGAGLVITAYGNGAGAAMQRHSRNHSCLADFHRSIHPESLMASLTATTKSAESAVQSGRAWKVTMDKAKSVIAHVRTPPPSVSYLLCCPRSSDLFQLSPSCLTCRYNATDRACVAMKVALEIDAPGGSSRFWGGVAAGKMKRLTRLYKQQLVKLGQMECRGKCGRMGDYAPKGGHCSRCTFCSRKGCGKRQVQRGLCCKHGARGTCTVTGCSTASNGRGTCSKHKERGSCSALGCSTKCVARGVCRKHAVKVACSASGCTNNVQARGICIKHGAHGLCSAEGCSGYAIKRRVCSKHGAHRLSKGICSAQGCTTIAQARGVCTKHGARGICSAQGCANKDQGKGLCGKHNGRDVFRSSQPRVVCSAQGCANKARAKGLCCKHNGYVRK